MSEQQTEYHVDEDLARTIAVGPMAEFVSGDDWALTFTATTSSHGEPADVRVRLDPRALHELYIEVKDVDADARQAGHSAECELCGDQVDLDRAIPDGQGGPCHRECWAEAFGAPDWFV